jgi:GNAT superfamily N-acetyltransferase
MSHVEVHVSCPVYDSFHVQQVAGLFDVPLAEKASASFQADVPDVDEPWQIGLIVGPSGSGKSTIARQAFGSSLYGQPEWPADRAVVDCFGSLGIKQITGLLTAVGFSSPPSWIKPYSVLSGGERFRCDLARAMSTALAPGEADRVVAFDEFTSVVDRNVAQVGSAAIAKAIRGGTLACRFVAVTCHYDVAEWLEPDWVVDMATGTCQRRRLRRPAIELELFRCSHRAWHVFAPHHYLSGSLSFTARCYLALWQGRAVAFCATLPVIGRKKHWRISRVVTLPDYQGVGIGMQVAEAVAELHRDQGHRLSVTASHPSLLAHCARSPRWRTVRVMKTGSGRTDRFVRGYRSSQGRAVVSFEYLGAAHST